MKIVRMQTKTFWKGELGIDGMVEDEGVSYTVRLEVKGKFINSYSCSCMKGNSYRQMCPHGQALYQYFEEKREEEDTRPVSTSSEARAMIREYTNREVAAILSQETEEPVDLGFRLLISRQEPRAEFFVGRERQYVLKDLGAFARAVMWSMEKDWPSIIIWKYFQKAPGLWYCFFWRLWAPARIS